MDKEVFSSVPGLVARVLVNEGDEVKSGDILAVLNAMKTEVNAVANEVLNLMKALPYP